MMFFSRSLKMAAVAAAVMSLSAPAFAHNHEMHPGKHEMDKPSHMKCDCKEALENPHVDAVKENIAPHTNIAGFMATGQLPVRDNYWRGKVEPGDGQRMMMVEKRAEMRERMKEMTPEERAKVHHKMEKRREIRNMKNMAPAERKAAKARWEQRKKGWDAMTPAQKAAAKANRDAAQ